MTERHEGSFAEGQEKAHDEESHHEGTYAEGQAEAEEPLQARQHLLPRGPPVPRPFHRPPETGRGGRWPPPRSARSRRRYLRTVISWKMGRYMAMTTPPMTMPRNTISIGSSREVRLATATSTSSS